MFYLLTIISITGYSLQNVLLARHARQLDALSLAFYRNLSFFITLLPLLIGSSLVEIEIVLKQWDRLLAAGIAGGAYLMILFTSYRYAPLGIINSFKRSSTIIFATILSTFFLKEHLSLASLLVILAIIFSCVWLSFLKNETKHFQQYKVGIMLACLTGIPLSTTFYYLTLMTRDSNPFVASFFWEIFIWVGILIVIFAKRLCFKQNITKISKKEFFNIALCSSPTLIGTGCFGLAVSMGPLSIITAIGSLSLVIVPLLAKFFYKEALSKMQWIVISAILIEMMLLKLVI